MDIGGILHWFTNNAIGAYLGGLVSGGTLVEVGRYFFNRYMGRKDRHEELVVGAYRAVRDAVADVKAAMATLEAGHDWNQEQHHSEYKPAEDRQVTATEIIERSRGDTGEAFSNAALAVLQYWDRERAAMWEGDYNSPVDEPSLESCEATLRASVPDHLRKRVYPGF